MPLWLQKLLFGVQRVDYLVSRASGRTFVGHLDLPNGPCGYYRMRDTVVDATSAKGDPTTFVQFDIHQKSAGLLAGFPRLVRALRPA